MTPENVDFAFVIYFRLVYILGSVRTTAQAYLRVLIGVAIGVVFLGEHEQHRVDGACLRSSPESRP